MERRLDQKNAAGIRTPLDLLARGGARGPAARSEPLRSARSRAFHPRFVVNQVRGAGGRRRRPPARDRLRPPPGHPRQLRRLRATTTTPSGAACASAGSSWRTSPTAAAAEEVRQLARGLLQGESLRCPGLGGLALREQPLRGAGPRAAGQRRAGRAGLPLLPRPLRRGRARHVLAAGPRRVRAGARPRAGGLRGAADPARRRAYDVRRQGRRHERPAAAGCRSRRRRSRARRAAARRERPAPSRSRAPRCAASARGGASASREIAARSKIGVRFLEYIEEDRHGLLPAPVYLRGFLQEYARAVGLDPRRTADAYLARLRRRS